MLDLDKLELMALPLAQASLAMSFQKRKLAPKLSMVAELALPAQLACMHLGSNLRFASTAGRVEPRHATAWQTSLFQHPMKLPDQACAHGCAPI